MTELLRTKRHSKIYHINRRFKQERKVSTKPIKSKKRKDTLNILIELLKMGFKHPKSKTNITSIST